LEQHKLSEDLNYLLAVKSGQRITVGSIFEAMGDRGFGLALMITSLPSALPIPAPGYSTPFGILLVLLAAQIFLGREKPWLPSWARKIVINEKLAGLMIRGASQFFARVEHLIKPRWSWAMQRNGHIFAASIVAFMGLLMAIPIPGTNTAPAGVIFLVGVAITEEDGLFLALASIVGVLTSLFYAIILMMIFYFGAAGVSEAWSFARSWIGL